jgi:UrcA family protein
MTKFFPALILALLPVPALAEPASNVSSIVKTADLDLSSRSGQRALDRRLAQAVNEVCGTASDVDIEGKNDVRRCKDETLARVIGERDQRIAQASASPIVVAIVPAIVSIA